MSDHATRIRAFMASLDNAVTVREIAQGIGGSSTAGVVLALQELEASGAVKKSGVAPTGATTWWAVQ